ncbi:MAG: Na/Pi cotransporter family protein [Lachnospiraceae bacterium]|nr:Na/Pi cotransporter family protein [Lachnospiraceae bacterium]
MDFSNVLALLGGVALFLFGMTVMGEGLKKVAGNKLEVILYKLSGTPIRGILLGTLVTSVIQSSSATTVMVVGFVNSGMMKVAQAIGVILGAQIGTSVTGWILSLSYIDNGAGGIAGYFSTAVISSVVAVIGILLRMFSKKKVKNNVGEILLGFAVLMYAMQSMSTAVAPLKTNASFLKAMSSFSNPFLGILIGIVFTAVIQSASAAVGVLQALSVTGAITFATAFPIILGIGIGAAAPVLLSAVGANVNGKRTAVVYLFSNAVGALLWGSAFYIVNAIASPSIVDMGMTPVRIALVNSVVRIMTVVVLAPFTGLTGKIVCALIKEGAEDEEDYNNTDKLEVRFLAYPPIAIEQSKMVVFAMADKVRKNVFRSLRLLYEYDRSKREKVDRKEDDIDQYEDKLGSYMVKLAHEELSDAEARTSSLILHTISDFERIGDHAVNIANIADEIHEKQIVFSKAAQAELKIMDECIHDIIETSFHAFVNESVEDCFKVEPLREVVSLLCDELKMRHIKRVQKGECALEVGFVFNDMIMNYERIAGHCSNIALAMIELETMSFDTHEYTNSLHDVKNDSYNKYLTEYEKKYALD